MKKLIRYIMGRTYRPLLVRYLSKERTYRYRDIRLAVPPQVFHPGFFFSTRLLLNQVKGEALKGKTLLEPGAGSGLLSIAAAKRGASVTATDINRTAVEYLQLNALRNRVPLRIIHSDLFESIPPQPFDYILINPPYYKKRPLTELDHAWYCGEQGEYFSRLFEGIGGYMHPSSKAWMVLCDGCDMDMIQELAAKNGVKLKLVSEKKNLVETNFIFRLQPGER
jgi:release factor glutamine methyltransferase